MAEFPGEMESRECAVLRKHYIDLRNRVNSNVQHFAGALYQNGFISTDIWRKVTKDADELLRCVVDHLESSRDKESRFREFLKIFSAEAAYKDLALTLEDAYVGSRRTLEICVDPVPLLSTTKVNKENDASGANEIELCGVSKKELIVVNKEDVYSACKELERNYIAKLKREFSHLVSESTKELENKLKAPEEVEHFKKDLKRRYKIKENYNEIEEMLDAVCEKENLQLENYQELFCILEEYANEETRELREKYSHLVTGWLEVKSFFDRFEKLAKVKYARTLQVRYKVRPYVADTINLIWEEICERFKLPPLKPLLLDQTYGSLLLTWYIDADVETSAQIRGLLIQSLPINIPFFRLSNITHLLYNFEVLYSDTYNVSSGIEGDSKAAMLYIKAEFIEPFLVFDIDPDTFKVFQLKEKIEGHWKWLKYFVYSLQFSERVLEDHNTLEYYGIKDQSAILLSSSYQEIKIPLTKTRQQSELNILGAHSREDRDSFASGAEDSYPASHDSATDIPTLMSERTPEAHAWALPLARPDTHPDPVAPCPPPYSLSTVPMETITPQRPLFTPQFTPRSSLPPPPHYLSDYSEATSKCTSCLCCLCSTFMKICQCKRRRSKVMRATVELEHYM